MEIAEIARHSGASTSTLLRKFRAETGTTPYSYIKNRRLEEALHLLKSGDQPISNIAILVGYENFGAFSEAFKQKYGKSPSAYRK
jgi:AraC-like DNA-binding protein